MDFSLTEQQQMLRSSARDLLEKECPPSLVWEMEKDEKGYHPALWQKMAGLGWTGIAVPEAYGGSGNSFLDLVILLEEIGYAAVPGPFFSTVVLGAFPVLLAGSEEVKQRVLPGVARGDVLLTLALTEERAAYDAEDIRLEAKQESDSFLLNGVKTFITDANAADYLVVVARTNPASGEPESGISLFLVDCTSPGLRLSPLRTLSRDKQFDARFTNVRVRKENLLGQLHQGWPVIRLCLQYATIGLCALMTGESQRAFELALEYSKQRVQFGQPVGAFQSLRHLLAENSMDLDGVRYSTYWAAWRLSMGLDASWDIHVTKAWVSDASRRITAAAQQIFAGAGYTADHPVQLYFRRVRSGSVFLGDADLHREAVASALGL